MAHAGERLTQNLAASINVPLLLIAVRVWLVEILVSGFNYFVLMRRVYQPIWGELVAHQIGMSSRIVYIFIFAYLLLRYAKGYRVIDLVQIGILWLSLSLVFEWAGSFATRRPVYEILVGWNVREGYMWPYVLAAYLLANLIVGTVLHPQRSRGVEAAPS